MPQRSIFDAGVTIQFGGDSAPPATAPQERPPAPAPAAKPVEVASNIPSPKPQENVPIPAPAPARGPDRLPGGERAPVPDPEPPQKPSTPSNPPIARSDAEGHIDQGIKHLLAAEYDAADSEFKYALKLEPKNGRAFHGRGLVALLKSRPGDATALMETALKNVSPGALPPRSLAYNLAAAHLKTNPMRSARIVKDYLSHPSAGVDEQMANALGAALNVADDSARNHFFYNEARDYYLKYDQRLAVARGDGRQRWGTQWLPAGQAASKWALYRQRAEGVADLRTRVGRATLDKAKAYDNLRYMQRGMRLHSTAEKRAANDKYEDAARHEITLRQQLARAESQMSATEAPPLPTSLDPVLDP